MTTPAFQHVVQSVEEMRALVGEPSELGLKKQLRTLDSHCRAFIAHSPFLRLGTSNAAGQCDVSPKGDAPGFLLVLDDRRLFIPDRPGNRRLDGMGNILENPHAGVIFFVPGREDTLRVNGRAWVVRDPALLERTAAMGKQPNFGIGLEVEECFLHCAKAFKRSRLWERDSIVRRSAMPSLGKIILEQTAPPAKPPTAEEVADCDKYIDEAYKTEMY